MEYFLPSGGQYNVEEYESRIEAFSGIWLLTRIVSCDRYNLSCQHVGNRFQHEGYARDHYEYETCQCGLEGIGRPIPQYPGNHTESGRTGKEFGKRETYRNQGAVR